MVVAVALAWPYPADVAAPVGPADAPVVPGDEKTVDGRFWGHHHHHHHGGYGGIVNLLIDKIRNEIFFLYRLGRLWRWIWRYN